MSAQVSFGGRLLAVITPTRAQALTALAVSLALLAFAQGQNILHVLGVSDSDINLTRGQFDERFSLILHTPLASNAALITFWASVGLIAYLICWAAYNLIVEARNEVTLSTQYTNRGHWQGPIETLALKAIGASILVILISLIKTGLALWIALAGPLTTAPSPLAAAEAAGAVLGLAIQIYLIFALVLVTFTPWYREETFTDQ